LLEQMMGNYTFLEPGNSIWQTHESYNTITAVATSSAAALSLLLWQGHCWVFCHRRQFSVALFFLYVFWVFLYIFPCIYSNQVLFKPYKYKNIWIFCQVESFLSICVFMCVEKCMFSHRVGENICQLYIRQRTDNQNI
jgi:hypothetical protein